MSARPAKKPAAKAPAKKPAADAGVELPEGEQLPKRELTCELPSAQPPEGWQAPVFTRPLNVAVPCTGIDGCGHALQVLGITDARFSMVHDVEGRYERYLQDHLPADTLVHAGRAGDITALARSMDKVQRPVDVLVSGPPCPPWSLQGKRQSTLDARSWVLIAVIKLAVMLIMVGELSAMVIENVVGISQKLPGQHEPFMQVLLRVLRAEVAQFSWGFHCLSAVDYGLPQQRTRVFLVGIRSGYGGVPQPLGPFGRRTLREFLAPGLPPVDVSKLTASLKKNLADAWRALRKLAAEGSTASVVCWPLDRSEGMTYPRKFFFDVAPTLTTANTRLFVASMDDLHMGPQQRAFWRFLRCEERMALQGFPPNTLQGESDALRTKASGNAYPVPLMMAVLGPLLRAMSEKQELLHDGPCRPWQEASWHIIENSWSLFWTRV
ncbi:hgiBIM [Symbiodinium sp. CCMP2592]|nr:hgiBIM [Symbiodinium sp. CCMP2592]